MSPNPNPLAVLAVNQHFDYCLLKMGNGGTQSLPRWRYDGQGRKHDNITDWSLAQFVRHYKDANPTRPITKDAIFYYVYAVLHNPAYKEKYALNLRREFPRIPFYSDFWRWVGWGETLMVLHIDYEKVQPLALKRFESMDEKSQAAGMAPKAFLRANREAGVIQIDSETQLAGIPSSAWGYVLGKRSALEWVLEQYREKSPKDSNVLKFGAYRFADHKEQVIDLLGRVARVSVETQNVVEAMRAETGMRVH